MKTIVFLLGKAIPRTTLDNPWFQELENTFDIEAWDIGDILFDGMPRHPYGTAVKERSQPVPSIEALRDGLSQKNHRETMLVFNVPVVHCRRNSERVVREICASGFEYIVRDVGNSFSPARDLRWFSSLTQRIKRKSILGFRNRRVWFWRSVRPPVFALVASRFVADWLKIQGLRTRFVRAHSRDYEHFLEVTSRGDPEVQAGSAGVFLDSPMFGCADMLLDGERPEFTAEQYYAQVRQVLSRLAEQAGLERIDVALHPSNPLTPEQVQTLLGVDAFQVSKGETASLIRNSCLVAGHHSSAFSLAVLFKKPVCLFCPAPPNTFSRERFTVEYARALGRRVNYPDTTRLDVGLDERAYQRFRDRYVKEPDTADMSHYQILGRELQAHFDQQG